MASSVKGPDKPNRALRLATRAIKIELSCPLGTIRCFPQEKIARKPYFVRSRWLDIVLVHFSRVYGPRLVSVHKHAKKKLANIQSSWPHTWSINHIKSHNRTVSYYGSWPYILNQWRPNDVKSAARCCWLLNRWPRKPGNEVVLFLVSRKMEQNGETP